MSSHIGRFAEILLVEDNSTAAERRRLAGVGSDDTGQNITVRVHRLNGASKLVVARRTYEAGSMRSKRSAKIELAAMLVDRAADGDLDPVVVAGTSYGSASAFLRMLGERDLRFVVQIRPSAVVRLNERDCPCIAAADVLDRGIWRDISAVMPDGTELECSAAKLAKVALPTGTGRLFAAQLGGIQGVHRGTLIGLSSFDGALADLVQLVAHARWIRRVSRKEKRGGLSSAGAEPSGAASSITARANITLARRQDARAQATLPQIRLAAKGLLRRVTPALNVVELFSGAGGMGLGFLLGGGPEGRYRIVYSGEANPIFVQTLRDNHHAFERAMCHRSGSRTPESLEPADLRKKSVLERAVAVAHEAGGAHFLIGGPPCQGFSMANRNSWSGNNPHNELVDVFIKYILRLRPLGFLMENVQGILWTPNAGTSVSVVDVIERRLKAAGYVLFPKLLDAAWYGVPQNRTRFFLMGLHRDLGYTADDFDTWGPFPKPSHGEQSRPLVTVREAIADLPRIGNGASNERSPYAEPSDDALQQNEFLRYARSGAETGIILDHVTSRHADYVIDRYRKIPAGGNWESIRDEMTNYADVSRTHSNIYRRLRWDEPSITIGHYRKSMLVHPSQNRGLSLREASRLQSFPDWFRFAGTASGQSGGLVHKQQQLANAVCPLVTKAIAEFMLDL
ncbi:DNA (cytosine-5-)-methyltransferase [Nannocystis pusilla]|uniref:DNA cytosine methyltransferase n=1 Tax=Nannocystis pusilla TaxID=889268 RepID=UPI003DA392B7